MKYRLTLKNIHHFTSITALLCLALSASAQVHQTHRFEREHKSGDEYHTIISLKEEGLALLREKNKFNGNRKQWELILLDTALKEKKTVEFDVEHRFPLIGYEVAPKQL